MKDQSARVLHSKFVEKANGNGAQEPQALHFGIFDVDLRAGELRRNGVRVKLQEQPFHILAQLLERPGDVVTREELRQRLWPADTFVDFDHSLNAAVRRLRDALGDSAENPIFVETVARRGYRFLAPVSVKANNGNVTALPAVEALPAVASRARRNWWLAGVAAAIALVYLGVKLGLLFAHSHAALPVRVTQLTANPEDDRVRAAAISPDGRYLAYSDETGFYLRQIDSAETHRIALPYMMRARSISWFPDNSHMVVGLSAVGWETSLWEISVLGGSARMLKDAGWAPTVSPDGRQIAFIGGTHFNQQVWQMDGDGTQPRKVAGEKGDFFGSVAWSPDGTKLACTHGRDSDGYGGHAEIDVLEAGGQAAGNHPAPLTREPMPGLDAPLAWTADNHMIYTLAEPPPRAQDSNLWSVEIDAQGNRIGAPARLTGDGGEVFSISVTSDGKRLGYVKGVPQPDVYVAQLQESGNITAPQRLTLDDHKDIPYDWTVDGKEVIFTSDRAGTLNVYKQALDQTVPELLVRDSHPLIESRLSPDGTQILYVQYPQWGENAPSSPLMRVPLAGGVPQKVLDESRISNQQCARAPATICIYSVVRDRTLTFFTFDPFRGKGTQILQIEEDLPQSYAWSLSPDGTMLALVKGKIEEPARIRLLFLDAQSQVRGGKWVIVKGWSLASLDWAADSKSLWAVSLDDEENALLNVDLEGRARVVWRPKDKAVWWAIPSRDNRWLALHVESTSANAWMLERP
jgi:DNA-binding winged helix-turn-helix (wHTH) protein/Tol biopolymer transport system component